MEGEQLRRDGDSVRQSVNCRCVLTTWRASPHLESREGCGARRWSGLHLEMQMGVLLSRERPSRLERKLGTEFLPCLAVKPIFHDDLMQTSGETPRTRRCVPYANAICQPTATENVNQSSLVFWHTINRSWPLPAINRKAITMGRALLDSVEDYDADTMTLLGRAFDSAWQDIAGNFDTATAENRRTRLALIILELAKGGERDEDAITAAAVKIMSYKEHSATFNGW